MQQHAIKQQEHWPIWLAWLLASAGIVILIVKYSAPIYSPDVWWHMALGRHILETGNLTIDHSIFTWTAGNPS